MAEWIGQFLGQFPVWISVPVAILVVAIGWILWMLFMDSGSDIFDRWYDRRRRERELKRDKK